MISSKDLLIIVFFGLLLGGIAVAVDFVPQGNILLNSRYGLYNATNITSGNLTAANCDVKADGTGALYCGTDSTGASAASGWTISGSNLYNDTSGVNVGIGTATPVAKLGIVGSVNISGLLNVTNLTVYNTKGVSNCDVKADANSGTLYCGTDANTGGGGSSYNQSLNTSDFVMFARVNVTSLLNVSSTGTLQLQTGGTLLLPSSSVTSAMIQSLDQSKISITLPISNTTGPFPQNRMSIENLPIANTTGSFPQNRMSLTLPYSNVTGVNTGWTTTATTVINDTAGVTVGIGTSNALEKLTVVGNQNLSGFLNTTNVYARNRLGVGTDNPITLLDVRGNANFTGIVNGSWVIGNFSLGIFPASSCASNQFATSLGINGLITCSVITQSALSITIPWANVTGPNTGWTTGASTVYNNTNGVKIGINTSAPTESLSIIGTINITNNAGSLGLYQSSSAKVGINTTNPTSQFTVEGHINQTQGGSCIWLPGGGRICGNATCVTTYTPSGVATFDSCN